MGEYNQRVFIANRLQTKTKAELLVILNDLGVIKGATDGEDTAYVNHGEGGTSVSDATAIGTTLGHEVAHIAGESESGAKFLGAVAGIVLDEELEHGGIEDTVSSTAADTEWAQTNSNNELITHNNEQFANENPADLHYYLSEQQKQKRDDALVQCNGNTGCEVSVEVEYVYISQMQNTALAAGIAEGVGKEAIDELIGLVELVTDPGMLVDSLKAIVNDPALLAEVAAGEVEEISQLLDGFEEQLEIAGWDGANNAGENLGRITAKIVALVGGAVGAAKVTKSLVKGVKDKLVRNGDNVGSSSNTNGGNNQTGGDVDNELVHSYLDKIKSVKINRLLDVLESKGVKYSKENIIDVRQMPDGKIVFLESGKGGKKGAGLQHIVEAHADDFIRKGVSEGDIPEFVMTALEKGKIVGYQGNGTGRPIYEVTFNGEEKRIAITVGDNGFVVGANPRD